MPDESPRSPSGHERRHTHAPSWWADLERADLPDDASAGAPEAPPRRRRGTLRQAAVAERRLPGRGRGQVLRFPSAGTLGRSRPGRAPWLRRLSAAAVLPALALLAALVAGLTVGGRAFDGAATVVVVMVPPAIVVLTLAWAAWRRSR